MTNTFRNVNISFMVTIEEIKNLANLARIELPESELESLSKEMGSILDYVSQIQNSAGDIKRVVPELHNIMREDVVTNTPGQYTEDILKNAPKKEKDYLVVKKIL